ncbi:acyl-CoA dehydrogenase family protein [Allosalinactinospora lopnorensis]|uniref:acyl-CoA dehydrogenase family protein n=1 Tax=Allosalinactinospora lopnorensis TaxID=1352348 RepID=UPI000623F573|nr:acyl-CoA dehydrogenase family protein [Allosalinactinospora lopnorensis]
MSFLERERSALERLLPGLDDTLADYGTVALEQPGSRGPALFKEAGGPGLLVPGEHGGRGADAVAAARCTRALASRSPSLAVAATMHNFSVASLVALGERSDGFAWMLIDAIAHEHLLMSSAFAEGRSGQNILRPAMRAERAANGWVVSGSKRPCSLSRSMDLITASIALPRDDGEHDLGIAVIPATQPGISVRPFWNSPVLTGAESDEVILDRVPVEDELIVRPDLNDASRAGDLQAIGLIWFSLLVGASYIGAASALAQRLLDAGRGSADIRAEVCWSLDTAMFAIERVALDVDAGRHGNEELAMALSARYGAQQIIGRATSLAVEALGGMSFISQPDVACLAATTHAAAFHPPSRSSLADAFGDYFLGGPLRLDAEKGNR